MANGTPDNWDVRAISWCLIDLIKRANEQGNESEVARYSSELSKISVPDGDEVLEEQRELALSMADQQIGVARSHSKAGRHFQAVRTYREIVAKGQLRPSAHREYGWSLYKLTKSILAGQKNPTSASVKQAKCNLNDYLKLEVERPSLLHSCMLRIATELAGHGKIKLPAFLDLWGLDNFRDEDFEPFTTDDGKILASLAEKVAQRAAKIAVGEDDKEAMQALLPFLEKVARKYPENVWLKYNSAKLLGGLDRRAEARELATAVVHQKPREYWAWESLGDLHESGELKVACYCKGLLLSSDEKYIGRLRTKLANELKRMDLFAEAKGEINAVVSYRQKQGQRIPDKAVQLMREPWFAETDAATPNNQFYARFTSQADSILYSEYDWIAACLGETYVPDGQPKKVLRKIHVADDPLPVEIKVPDRVLRLKGLSPGHPIQIKADLEIDSNRLARVHVANVRDAGKPFDVFPEIIGIVDQINRTKGVIHVTVGRDDHHVVQMSAVGGIVSLGDCVKLLITRFHSKSGGGKRVVSATRTSEGVSEEVCQGFREGVTVSGGMGFTSSGIFVPPQIVRDNNIQHGDLVSGRAVISFDKKKNRWSWKAISACVADEKRQVASGTASRDRTAMTN